MKKTKFDLLVENIISITEGRKKKVYPKLVFNFNKFQEDINNLEDSPYKALYQYVINKLKQINGKDAFSLEELSSDPKTMPEWEEEFLLTLGGKENKKEMFTRLFRFVTDTDRGYFSEQTDSLDSSDIGDKPVESIEDHIYNFIKQSSNEDATMDEIVHYISRYGLEEDEIIKIVTGMLKGEDGGDGKLREEDGKYYCQDDPSLDELDPSDSDLNKDGDDMEGFKLSDDDADLTDEYEELGLNPKDPFDDDDFYRGYK